jgi:hypothetical protein
VFEHLIPINTSSKFDLSNIENIKEHFFVSVEKHEIVQQIIIFCEVVQDEVPVLNEKMFFLKEFVINVLHLILN